MDSACAQGIHSKKEWPYSWHFDIYEVAEMEEFKDQRYMQ